MRQMRYRFFLLPLLLVVACAAVFAQANSELTGIVTDQSGAVIAGAKIVLTDPATGATKTTESGGTGLYDINGLNPANYNLKVTAKGFEAFVQNTIPVNVSSTARIDIHLTVGAETQTVTVEADALAVQTDSNVVSTLISSEQISEIATENRNFAALAALGLGVSSALPDSNTPTSVAANFTISVNGLRQSHNIWLIDGGEADDRGGAGGMDIMPSQDAIAEFNMMTSNYPPDYGISSGATMSLSLKSGTQKFHGELWEFNRNPHDAYDFNKEPISRSLTNIHYNIFGGNIGGPLYIPHVYNTDKQKTSSSGMRNGARFCRAPAPPTTRPWTTPIFRPPDRTCIMSVRCLRQRLAAVRHRRFRTLTRPPGMRNVLKPHGCTPGCSRGAAGGFARIPGQLDHPRISCSIHNGAAVSELRDYPEAEPIRHRPTTSSNVC